MKHIIKFIIFVGFGYLWRKMGSRLSRKLVNTVENKESQEAYHTHGPDHP